MSLENILRKLFITVQKDLTTNQQSHVIVGEIGVCSDGKIMSETRLKKSTLIRVVMLLAYWVKYFKKHLRGHNCHGFSKLDIRFR